VWILLFIRGVNMQFGILHKHYSFLSLQDIFTKLRIN